MGNGWLEVGCDGLLKCMVRAEIFSGAADPATHKIYIWDISNDGQFVSTLDGGREPLLHLHVTIHPTPFIIVTEH